MGSSGSFPIDLVLLGMVAAFLVLRLRSILGKRTGFERSAPPVQPFRPAQPQPGPVIDGRAEPPVARPGPDAASPMGQTLAQMRQIDRNFDPGRFLAGAEQAFRMIVGAFAGGDRQSLRNLLSAETYGAFDQAIAAREKAGERQTTEIRSVHDMKVENAELRGRVAAITVRIVSDQVNHTLDKDGRSVAGTDAVTEIVDLWTFERDLGQQDPTWRLVAARSG